MPGSPAFDRSAVQVAEGDAELVLTANRRLARYLQQAGDDAAREAGHEAWERREILPLSSWLKQTWERGWEEEALLSDAQLLAVWEGIVHQDVPGGDLPAGIMPGGIMDARRLARTAYDAWGLCRQWGVAPQAWRYPSPECEVFMRWAETFARTCRERCWIDAGTALDRVISRVACSDEPVPAAVRLAGFDNEFPQLNDLMAAFIKRGATVTVDRPVPPPGASCSRVTADNPAHEADLVAGWARGLLESGVRGPIGIVSPDLSRVRFHLERALRDRLHPGAVTGWDAHVPVNVSMGIPLSQVPPVAAALAMLKVGRRPLENARMGAILRSSFLGRAQGECAGRALATERMLRHGPRTIRLEELPRHLGTPDQPAPQGLRDLLSGWLTHIRGLPERQRPSRWARSFTGMLEAVGWPGESQLDSTAWQAVEKWSEALARFATLDAVLPYTTRGGAVARLERICREIDFQPAGEGTAPVQVLGVLEAAGMRFSHLWVMGLSDTVWPAPSNPNPFIPYEVQRALAMPHGGPEVELQFARSVTERLLAAAPEVVVSYPNTVDGRVVGPSPLIRDVPERPPPLTTQKERYAVTVAADGRVAPVDDTQGPPVSGRAVGGAKLFADQSACPFKAFATHRLGARGLEREEIGLDARDRGEVAHGALKAVWEALGTQRALKACTPEALEAVVARAVDATLPAWLEKRGMGKRFADSERARLMALVGDWLAVDLSREVPFSVVALEQRATVELGGVTVSLQLDRVDATADGREVLIDYKTGSVNRSRWDGERPGDPQLPLYVLSREPGKPAALAFGRLKRNERGEVGYEGRAESAGILPAGRQRGVVQGEEGWREMVAGWRAALTEIGAGFARGQAAVDPLNPAESCLYCDLKLLCRIEERRAGVRRGHAGGEGTCE